MGGNGHARSPKCPSFGKKKLQKMRGIPKNRISRVLVKFLNPSVKISKIILRKRVEYRICHFCGGFGMLSIDGVTWLIVLYVRFFFYFA